MPMNFFFYKPLTQPVFKATKKQSASLNMVHFVCVEEQKIGSFWDKNPLLQF